LEGDGQHVNASSSSSFGVLEIWLPLGFEEMLRRKPVSSSVLECRKIVSNRMPRIVNSWPSLEKAAWRVTSPDALYAPPPRHSMYGKGPGRSHVGTRDRRVSPGPGHEFSEFTRQTGAPNRVKSQICVWRPRGIPPV
jgi:hypothetical protein